MDKPFLKKKLKCIITVKKQVAVYFNKKGK